MDSAAENTEFQDPLGIRARNLTADILSIVIGRWYWIALMLILCVGGAFYYLSITPRFFQSTATVQVFSGAAPGTLPNNIPSQSQELDTRSADAINTIVGKFRLLSLYQSMLQEFPALMQDPELLPEKLDWSPRWLRAENSTQGPKMSPVGIFPVRGAKVGGALSEEELPPARLTPEQVELRQKEAAEATRLAPEVAEFFQISNRRQTRLVDITVSHTSPRMSQILADALVATYEKIYGDLRLEGTQSRLDLLKNQASQAKEELQELRNARVAYSTALEKSKAVRAKDAELKDLLVKFREKHPDVKAARQKLSEVQESFMTEFKNSRQSPADREYWQKNPFDESGELPDEIVMRGISQLEARSEVLDSDIKSQQDAYERLLDKQSGTVGVADEKQTEVLPLEPSREGELFKPKPLLIYMAGGLAGMILGFGLALLIEKMDNRVHTVADLEKMTTVPVLASMAALRPVVLKQPQLKPDPGHLMNAWAPDLFFRDNGATTIEAEMIRTLRTSLILLGPQDAFKCLLFTSALPGEGKSFISANVGASFAMQGVRTLVVDMDLRRPRQHMLFGTTRQKGAGVVDVLAGQIPIEHGFHPTGLDNLYLMPAGSHAPNPGELLNVDRLREFLSELKKRFDRIIIDTAPMLPVADTRLISRSVDACMLVVRAEKNPKGASMRALELLTTDAGGGRAVMGGCVLNGVTETRRNRSYNYSYGYYGKYGGKYGGYGAVYGEDEKQ